MFHRIIFILLIVSSLPCNLPLMFSVVHEHRLQEYSKRRAHQTLFKFTHRYKPLNKKINTINSLLYWSVTLLMFIQTLHSLQLAGRYIGDFGNFLTVSLKAHASFDRPEYIGWVQIIFHNCEILHSVWGLYDKNSAS